MDGSPVGRLTDKDLVEVVKKCLGQEAAEYAEAFYPRSNGIVVVTFPEGQLQATVDSEGNVAIVLPLWAEELGWEITDD